MSVSTYEAAIKKLKGSSENVEEIKGTFPPTLQLTNKEGKAGAYVSGVLLSRRSVKIQSDVRPVYNIKLVETNSSALKKEDGKWVKVEVSPGDTVSLFAPTRLERILKDLGPETKVVIHYDGKIEVKGKRGTVMAHSFTVHASKNGKTFTTDSQSVDGDVPKETASPNEDPFA